MHIIHVPRSYGAKVSYQPYINMSRKIFRIFRRFSGIVQKASIDEAYFDVTSQTLDIIERSGNDYGNW